MVLQRDAAVSVWEDCAGARARGKTRIHRAGFGALVKTVRKSVYNAECLAFSSGFDPI
jgi:hypothetical protein